MPHVSAVEEGNLFMSLDLHSYIVSYSRRFLIGSAFVFLGIIIDVLKSLSTGSHCSTVDLTEVLPVVAAHPW